MAGTRSKSLAELQEAVDGFKRLLLPVRMQLIYMHLGNQEIADDTMLFTFSGGGASDWTTVGDFRKLMGDERLDENQAIQVPS